MNDGPNFFILLWIAIRPSQESYLLVYKFSLRSFLVHPIIQQYVKNRWKKTSQLIHCIVKRKVWTWNEWWITCNFSTKEDTSRWYSQKLTTKFNVSGGVHKKTPQALRRIFCEAYILNIILPKSNPLALEDYKKKNVKVQSPSLLLISVLQHKSNSMWTWLHQ